MSEAQSTEMVRSFSVDDLRGISSFEDAVNLLTDHGVAIQDATTAIGDGFVMLEDKDALLGKRFIVMSAVFSDGDYGNEYVILRVVSADGKWIITDGGTGIPVQVRSFMERNDGSALGLDVKRGLRKSEYDNEHGHGVTYYLNV